MSPPTCTRAGVWAQCNEGEGASGDSAPQQSRATWGWGTGGLPSTPQPSLALLRFPGASGPAWAQRPLLAAPSSASAPLPEPWSPGSESLYSRLLLPSWAGACPCQCQGAEFTPPPAALPGPHRSPQPRAPRAAAPVLLGCRHVPSQPPPQRWSHPRKTDFVSFLPLVLSMSRGTRIGASALVSIRCNSNSMWEGSVVPVGLLLFWTGTGSDGQMDMDRQIGGGGGAAGVRHEGLAGCYHIAPRSAHPLSRQVEVRLGEVSGALGGGGVTVMPVRKHLPDSGWGRAGGTVMPVRKQLPDLSWRRQVVP